MVEVVRILVGGRDLIPYFLSLLAALHDREDELSCGVGKDQSGDLEGVSEVGREGVGGGVNHSSDVVIVVPHSVDLPGGIHTRGHRADAFYGKFDLDFSRGGASAAVGYGEGEECILSWLSGVR